MALTIEEWLESVNLGHCKVIASRFKSIKTHTTDRLEHLGEDEFDIHVLKPPSTLNFIEERVLRSEFKKIKSITSATNAKVATPNSNAGTCDEPMQIDSNEMQSVATWNVDKTPVKKMKMFATPSFSAKKSKTNLQANLTNLLSN